MKKSRKSRTTGDSDLETETEVRTDAMSDGSDSARSEEGQNDVENGQSPNKKRKKDDKAEADEAGSNESEKTRGGKKKKADEEEAANGSTRKSRGGKKKVEKKKAAESDKEEEYEVEKIVGQRQLKGKRQFLVRWLGYTQSDDTWENENELNCNRLIEEFLADQEKEEENGSPAKKTAKKGKGKATGKKTAKKQPSAKSKADEGDSDEDEASETEYEVEKIMELHTKKDGSREFLIRWKGFKSSDDTWEPEAHLNCKDMIAKFMEKVDQAKNFDSKEAKLRVNPSHTKRFTLTMHADKRQSRRNANKERKSYYED